MGPENAHAYFEKKVYNRTFISLFIYFDNNANEREFVSADEIHKLFKKIASSEWMSF